MRAALRYGNPDGIAPTVVAMQVAARSNNKTKQTVNFSAMSDFKIVE
jgi:hypothetical protein